MPLLYGGKVFWVFWWFILSPLSGATITSPPYRRVLITIAQFFCLSSPHCGLKLKQSYSQPSLQQFLTKYSTSLPFVKPRIHSREFKRDEVPLKKKSSPSPRVERGTKGVRLTNNLLHLLGQGSQELGVRLSLTQAVKDSFCGLGEVDSVRGNHRDHAPQQPHLLCCLLIQQ